MLVVTAPNASRVAEGLRRLGKTPADCVRLMGSMSDSIAGQRPAVELKRALRDGGVEWDGDAFERLLLHYAAEDALPKLDALPVHPAVKALFRKEFQSYAKAPGGGPDSTFEAGAYLFGAAMKIASLRRFPGGPMDWVISGIPRSWAAKIAPREMPRALRFILTKMGGWKPMFYMHVAPPPRKRTLVMEKEVRKAYYRMARSMELQPEIKGLACASWFHDPAMLRENPLLAPLNEPYLEHGGMIVTVGPAPADSGFLERSPERRKQFEAGLFRPMLGLAMWPRKAAIAWAQEHPELEG